MTAPNTHDPHDTRTTPAPNPHGAGVETHAGSAYWLGQIVIKLENIEKKIEKVEQQESRISNVEKDVLATKKDIQKIEADIGEIKYLVQEPKKAKTTWWQISSGLAGIAALVISTTTIITLLTN